ncbi:patatin-like phospholipase RssA [Skermanella sp. TT6]|uniref:patatin-like phospholipase RssA n=1 Tax=Skermanella cutis TaxID=2775420 RepID=UPI001FFE86F8|nr:patatin-like phospholipase RssA [Skermanella sp. TT6]
MKIGLALGSGAARGWAHIGVLRSLEASGIRPDIVCGTSVGALVGGAWLTGQLDALQEWASTMGLFGVLKLLDVTFSRGGLVSITKAFEQFRNDRTDVLIEHLPTVFATVATDLATGREVWLREGHLLDVVRASAAMPGLFPAVPHDGQWLVDGALVNPVPVSLCRALGADVVIAVNLNGDLATLPRLAKGSGSPEGKPPAEKPPVLAALLNTRIGSHLSDKTRFLASQLTTAREPVPNVLEILAGSIDIMQDRITRSRLAGEPPDVLIAPRLGHIGILDFDRSEELIELGRTSTDAMGPAITLAVRRA